MKAKNLNNSSKKTVRTIKNVFAEMLSEKKELGKISVSELCQRAEISRGAFYAHYDDIYGVAEDYENELIDVFFDNACLLTQKGPEQFVDTVFAYIRQNDENYKLLCRSNDLIFAAKKLTAIASAKFLELSYSDPRFRDKRYIELEINLFVDGLLCEYVRYCRDYSSTTLDDLYGYTKYWLANFIERRSALPAPSASPAPAGSLRRISDKGSRSDSYCLHNVS